MTELEWNGCQHTYPMLDFLRRPRRPSVRKLRLFAVGCWRRLIPVTEDCSAVNAIEVSERRADLRATMTELREAQKELEQIPRELTSQLSGLYSILEGRFSLRDARWSSSELPEQCAILRELFGPLPFRPISFAKAWRSWNAATVPQLALAAYEERNLPAATLDPPKLALVADALEDAGCTDAELLGHLRGPGPHVRGCWALDLVLGKE